MNSWLRRIRRCLLMGVAGTVLAAGVASSAGAAVVASAPSTPQVCASKDDVEQVRTDHARYRVGQPVKITVIAWNVSSHDCVPPPTVRVTVRSSSGATVFESGAGILWVPEFRWRPGQSLTWGFTWDTRGVPAGRYVATGSWDSYPPASTSFTIGTAG